MTYNQNTFIKILSISIIYFWFGFLKFFPELSPAETLAKNTIDLLTYQKIPSNISFFLLAFWECTIAISLLFKTSRKVRVYMALIHMTGTFLPFIILPLETHNTAIYSLTLIGQYIIKNIVIISALIVIFPRDLKHLSLTKWEKQQS